MNDEIKQYLKNYLRDLNYWSGLDYQSVNFYTDGTPTLESIEELNEYIKPLEDLLMDDDIRLKKSRIGSLQHWEEQFHKQGWVDDEHGAYIASVLATERRELERRVEAHEMKEQGDEVRILMNVHCLLCLATFPENSTASTVDTCPNCGNADKKQIIHLQEQDNE